MYDGTWNSLLTGFAVALQPTYLLYSFVGAFLGTVVGVVPGLGPAAAIAMLLPIIFALDPLGSIIMLAAVYTGAMYGGSTTSILLRVPGDTASIIACLDGHEMAKQGRAGPALCIAAIGSYIAGTIALVGVMLVAPVVADAALAFSAPEYFMLYIFGLTAVSSLASDSLLKAFMALVLGLMISTVGQDLMGTQRFTFGSADMWDGIQFLPLTLGLFALSEVTANAKTLKDAGSLEVLKHRVIISLAEIRESLGAIFRGGAIGYLIGILPGAGAAIASFVSYAVEKKVSHHPERFGKGEITGVAGPESANNAASAGALVPMLALGVPGSASTGVMLGAFVMLNIQPGPLMFVEHPDVVWGLIAALYIGNIMLLIMNLPLVGIFVRILYLPMQILIPLIVALSVIGVYIEDGTLLSLLFLCLFGFVGYYMRIHGYPLAPALLGYILGAPLEKSFRQSMIMTQGNLFEAIDRPLVIAFLGLTLVAVIAPFFFGKRKVTIEDEG